MSDAQPGYDPTTKFLVEHFPADFLRLAGLPVDRRPVQVVDADLSTVMAATDKVIRVGTGRRAYVVTIDFQVRRDVGLDERMHYYYAAARRRHRLPVRTVVFALHPRACPPAVRGRLIDRGDGRTRLDFRYHLVRAYASPPDTYLAGGIGTLPMAVVSAVGRGELPAVLAHVRRRLDAEVPPAVADEVWSSTGVLAGIRYTAPVARALIDKVRTMRESSVYQMILNEGRVEGRVEGERTLLLRVGAAKFGPADAATARRLTSITDPAAIEGLGVRLLTATTWAELLGS